MKPLISIIVPIYNVEKYIDKCLHTIRNQTLKNIEIICIDDCSPDNSSLIVEEHQKEDSRISLIYHATNTGLGGARNTGICMAKADYIASVDSDDFIKPEMMEILWKATDNKKYDIVCCGFERVDEKGVTLIEQKYSSKIVNTINDRVNIFSLVNPAFWNKVWRRSLFIENNIFFPEHDYFEDMSTTPRLVSKATQIKIIENILYTYMVREGSITTTYSEKHILDYFKGFEVLQQYLEDNDLLVDYENNFLTFINGSLRFHSNNVINSGAQPKVIELYLKQLLLLKYSFIDNRELLCNKTTKELFTLLAGNSTSFYKSKAFLLLDEISQHKEIDNDNQQQLSQYREIIKKTQQQVLQYKETVSDSQQQVLQYKEILNDAKQNFLNENNKNTTKIKNLKHEVKHLLKESSIIQAEVLVLQDSIQILEQEKESFLTNIQKTGVFIFGFIFRPFISPKKYLKLKSKPKLFFKDSKNSFTRSIGFILGL